MSTSSTPQRSAAISQDVLDAARAEVEAAEDRAGVRLVEIHDAQMAADASLLLDEVWNVGEAGTTVLEPGLFVALAHSGNYCAAAVDAESGAMIGVTVGFFGAPLGEVMHSHIAGVRHDQIGRGTGAAMKLHQRLWCLERGITEMTWTFDPLIARNAYFNFQRLGARCIEYLEDFYGQMRDGVNAGQASDRMLVGWRLDRTRDDADTIDESQLADAVYALRSDDEGRPHEFDVPKEASLVALDFPSDVESLRGADADLATQWREALRRALTELLADGWEIIGCLRGGTYLLRHPIAAV